MILSLYMKNVSSGYEYVLILREISMEVKKWEITTVLGPNGSGKTTLLKTIFGIVKPTKGRIFLDSKDITSLAPYKILQEGIAYVFQRRSIFRRLTVQENLELAGWSIRKNKEIVRERMKEIYKRFPTLERKKSAKAAFLSGGEQRMLEISRALILRPKVLLLDEPSAGLAPKYVKQVYETIKQMKKEELTILLIDQNIRAAIEVADNIFILELGRIKFGGSKDQLDITAEELIKSWLV